MTTTRGQVARLRSLGVKKSRSATSSEESLSPVASKTRPLYVWPSSAWVVDAMPRVSRSPGSDSASRPVPPVTTMPSTSGAPAV